IVISLLENRPSRENFFNSNVLQEFTRATNVRLRLLKTKNLLGHLMSVAKQDPTTTRRYFYSIKDISIGGRCRCNGHAVNCDQFHPENKYQLICRCQHNTCGDNCEVCCPGFEQKAWRQSISNSPFTCERKLKYLIGSSVNRDKYMFIKWWKLTYALNTNPQDLKFIT
ncbi:hypothetical protein WDU94_000673, partial [Cyamophila willieti]